MENKLEIDFIKVTIREIDGYLFGVSDLHPPISGIGVDENNKLVVCNENNMQYIKAIIFYQFHIGLRYTEGLEIEDIDPHSLSEGDVYYLPYYKETESPILVDNKVILSLSNPMN